MKLTYKETKKLLYLVRREQRNEKPWAMFAEKSSLKTLEQKLLEWYNNGAKE